MMKGNNMNLNLNSKLNDSDEENDDLRLFGKINQFYINKIYYYF